MIHSRDILWWWWPRFAQWKGGEGIGFDLFLGVLIVACVSDMTGQPVGGTVRVWFD